MADYQKEPQAEEKDAPQREKRRTRTSASFFEAHPPRIDEASSAEPTEPSPTRGERLKNYALGKTPQKFRNPSELQIRLRTGAIYVSITVLCLILGNIPTVLMLSVTAGIAAGEFFYMLRKDAKLPNEFIGIVGAVLYPPCMYLWGLAGVMVLSIALLVALIVWYVFFLRARIADVCVSFFGATYTGLLLSSLVLVRASLEFPWGGVLALIVFASVWINDGFAYLVGSKFGKHKMAPRISPKKSWEGLIGGLFGSCLTWSVCVLIPGVEITIGQAILFGVVCGVMSVLGDLAESRIKRNAGFKDSGTIMPGHGGLLDRTDSMFLAAVTAAFLLLVFQCIPYTFYFM
ncbi:MAG: phosphatidate cytidylyltransferase [Eggerthellaceae bacterium]|nr:phosphatidate cytidylyltransferase [Eggerthellaceae bacterium]